MKCVLTLLFTVQRALLVRTAVADVTGLVTLVFCSRHLHDAARACHSKLRHVAAVVGRVLCVPVSQVTRTQRNMLRPLEAWQPGGRLIHRADISPSKGADQTFTLFFCVHTRRPTAYKYISSFIDHSCCQTATRYNTPM